MAGEVPQRHAPANLLGHRLQRQVRRPDDHQVDSLVEADSRLDQVTQVLGVRFGLREFPGGPIMLGAVEFEGDLRLRVETVQFQALPGERADQKARPGVVGELVRIDQE